MTEQGFPAGEIDTSKPHPARMYDFFLGGWDNYEVDREAAQRVVDIVPDIIPAARANREFLHRGVRFLAENGIDQIIDIGTGIPTSPNTHEIAHSVDPGIRVAYVDNDPIVAAHAGAKLTGTGNTGFLLGDLRDPVSILEHPTIGKLVDFDRPVGLLLVAVLHFLKDEEDPAGVVATLRDALPSGSFLVLSHATADFHTLDEVYKIYDRATATLNPRTHAQVGTLFDGFEMLDPGLVQVALWRPEGDGPSPEEVRRIGFYGAVARRP